MNDTTHPSEYWNRVAGIKTFTHPLDLDLLKRFVDSDSCIVDFGCGYGRIVEILNNNGFKAVQGYDTSDGLIDRGHQNGIINISWFHSIQDLPVSDSSVDCFILFAVLTCIAENEQQQLIIDTLYKKLKPGGIVYISDYYMQAESQEVKQYHSLNGNPDNNGVFELPEGAVFRHHSKEWITHLVRQFVIKNEHLITVQTMNGNDAEAFQLIIQKT